MKGNWPIYLENGILSLAVILKIQISLKTFSVLVMKPSIPITNLTTERTITAFVLGVMEHLLELERIPHLEVSLNLKRFLKEIKFKERLIDLSHSSNRPN